MALHDEVSADDVLWIVDDEVAKRGLGYEHARTTFEQIATGPDYVEFLTLPVHERLVERPAARTPSAALVTDQRRVVTEGFS